MNPLLHRGNLGGLGGVIFLHLLGGLGIKAGSPQPGLPGKFTELRKGSISQRRLLGSIHLPSQQLGN